MSRQQIAQIRERLVRGGFARRMVAEATATHQVLQFHATVPFERPLST